MRRVTGVDDVTSACAAGEEVDLTGGGHSVVIVGASAAGLRCASRLARLHHDWSIKVVEEREIFSFAACGLPYVLSGDIADLDALRRTGDGALRDAGYFADVKGVEVLAGWRGVEVDTDASTLLAHNGEGREQVLAWDELVLATGARPRRLHAQPDHPRVICFHTPEDVTPLHQGLARGKIERAVVIGAGILGCELAEAFGALWGAEVTLVEAASTPLPLLLDPPTGRIVAHTLAAEDISLRTDTRVESIEADDDEVRVLVAGGEKIVGDVAVVAIGVEPAVELATSAGVRLGATGAVAVDERFATSVPHVWAIGDAIETRHAVSGEAVHLPLGSLANRQGRTLANILAGGDDRFEAVAGATALKVFDLNVAATGLTAGTSASSGMPVKSVWISAHDRADYWPEAKEIAVQLSYRADTRQVVGVQAVGEGEVAKRVDVATRLICSGATLREFTHVEHAYSPPFAPALEPLAVAAMVAENLEDGIEVLPPDFPLGGSSILDVRHQEETAARPLPYDDVTVVPLDSLRKRLGDIDSSTWVVVCERGTRSAETVRWLREQGVSARYLGGGLRWRELAGLDASAVSPTD